jgi:hypothetical protein
VVKRQALLASRCWLPDGMACCWLRWQDAQPCMQPSAGQNAPPSCMQGAHLRGGARVQHVSSSAGMGAWLTTPAELLALPGRHAVLWGQAAHTVGCFSRHA